jgi:hypothetical protein
MNTWFNLVISVGAIACVPPSTTPSLDNTFGSYAHALDPDGTNGLIPKSLAVPGPIDEQGHLSDFKLTAMTRRPMWARSITYDGLDHGQICFQEWESGADPKQDADELGKEHYRGLQYRLEVLSEIPNARKLWPSNGAPIVYKDVAEDKTDDSSGLPIRNIYWKACAPAPEVASNTQYLAVVIHHDTPLGHEYVDDELLLWRLK